MRPGVTGAAPAPGHVPVVVWQLMASCRERGLPLEPHFESLGLLPEDLTRPGCLVDPAVGLLPFQARKLAFGLGIPAELTGKAVKFMTALYSAFVDTDCSLAEINPLVLTEDGDIVVAMIEEEATVKFFRRRRGRPDPWPRPREPASARS